MRRLITAHLAALLAFAAAGLPGVAEAAEPVPCIDIGGGRYECDWWRPGDGRTGGSMVVDGGVIVGWLHRGRNWIVCQQRGARVTSGGNWNDWYGWTESDPDANGEPHSGWVSALDANGGTDGGEFGGGVPDCGGAHGPAPSVEGVWETSPPSAPPPPPPSAPAPQIDESLYRAGGALAFDPGGGCTSAFPVLVRGRVHGLSAGHCSEISGGDVTSWFAPAKPWTVRRNVSLSKRERIDALMFASRSGLTIGYAQEILREGLAPLPIQGLLRRDEQTAGMTVCFAGVTSGADRCGPLLSWSPPQSEHRHLLCAGVAAAPGDSGGPVYSAPSGTGAAQALGVVTLALFSPETAMCYEPIDGVLDRLGATLASGSAPASRSASRFPLRSVVVGARSFTPRVGVRVSVRLARSARVIVKLRRVRSASSSRRASSQTLRLKGHRGVNRFRIVRVDGRRLQRGRYAAQVTAVAGRRSGTWPFVFHVR
ncbi:MAG TPA: hypothetical protein VKB25_14150 [Conexibacter sp.]|nr:hypothetical protein [Conexibacter sp.]